MSTDARLRKGLRADCLQPGLPMAERFRLARTGGFEGIELTLAVEGPFSLQPSARERVELRRLAADEVPILGLNAGAPWRFPPSALASDVRARGRALVLHSIDLAADLGVDTLLYIPGVVTADEPFMQVWDAARAATEALLPRAEQAGVTLAVENVWNGLILSPRDMRAFVDGFDSPRLRVYFDVGNVMQWGFPQHWIEALGAERIARVHVKDFQVEPGGWLGFTQLLHGDVDWPAAMQALRRVGYAGWVTPEVPPSSAPPDAWVRQLSAAMDTIIGFYRG